ncbi:MAG: delta-60 repeat domain-containing protein, partial [Verrucomicrobiota bacterium]|nr:delta-60 repeat domain-containing protein [Verrucomicrobiota bacterium]
MATKIHSSSEAHRRHRLIRIAALVGLLLASSQVRAQSGDGSLDKNLINRADFQAYPVFGNVARQADGKVIEAGDFTAADGLPLKGLARLNPDGTLDRTFDAKIDQVSGVRALLVQPDGKLLIGGLF